MAPDDAVVPVAVEKVVAVRGDGGRVEHLAVLRESDGDRRMPVPLDPNQAIEVSLTLEAMELPRPFPAHLTARVVEAAGGGVGRVRLDREVEVGDLGAAVAATIEITTPRGIVEVDARASDAVGLAAVTRSTIVVSEAVLAGSGPSRHTYPGRAARLDAAANAQPARWRRVGSAANG